MPLARTRTPNIMFDEILSRVFFNPWAGVLIISLLVLVFSEAGFRCGVASRRRNAHSAENIGGSVRARPCRKLPVLLLPLPPSQTTTLSNLMLEIALAEVSARVSMCSIMRSW